MINQPGQHTSETPWLAQHWQDWQWCMGQADILRDYAGQVIVLHERQVLGSGQGHLEALEDAQQRVEAAGQSLPEDPALIINLGALDSFLDVLEYEQSLIPFLRRS
jgi:hypothetical protein